MRKRHRATSIQYLLILFLLVANGGDAASAQEEWSPWPTYGGDKPRVARPKRPSQPKAPSPAPAVDAAGGQKPAAPPGPGGGAASGPPPAAQPEPKPPATPDAAIKTAATAVASAEGKHKIEIVPQIAHLSYVGSVAFSPDGRQVLSGSEDKSVKLWDAATGQLVRTFEGHSEGIQSVAFSPDGRQVLSGGGKTIKLWNAATGKVVRTFEGHFVTSVAFSPDGRQVLSGSGDDTIKLWDAATGQVARSFEKHSGGKFTGGVTSVAFSPDGRLLLSGSAVKSVKLWDAATGQVVRTFEGHSEGIKSVAFSPDGRQVLSGGGDNTVKLWDAATGQVVRTFKGHSGELPFGGVTSVAFSPDGRQVLSGGIDSEVKLWDAATGQVVHSFKGHYYGALSVSFSPDGRQVLSGGGDNTVKLWDAATRQLVSSFEGHSSRVRSVRPSPDGRQVLSGIGDQTVKLWDAATGQLVRTLVERCPDGFTSDGVYSVSISPNGLQVLSVSGCGPVKLWDGATGQVVRTFKGHSDHLFGGGATSAAFSPDGRQVLTGGNDRTLKLWDAATGEAVRTFEEHSDDSPFGGVTSVAFSPDGRHVLSGSRGPHGGVKLWDAATGEVVRTFEGFGITSVAFSPDGRQVLSVDVDNTLKLWDAPTGQVVRTFERHSDGVASAAFSSDGRQVLSGGNDHTLKLWDVATGQVVRTFEGHSGRVTSVAFSPDGRQVLSGSVDTTTRVWKTDTGELLATFVASRDGEWLVLTPEGFFNASSPTAGKLLSVVRGLKVTSIDQFWQALYRPDLVKERLAGDASGKVKEAAAKLDLDKILDSGPVPRVLIKTHKAIETSASDLVIVTADVSDTGGGIGKIEWRINGVTEGVSDGAVVRGSPAASIMSKQSFALDPGDNTIEVVAYNHAGLVTSVPAKTTIKWTGTQPSAKPRLHVLAIGINDYYEGKLRLKFGVPDATSLANALKEAGKDLYAEVSVTPAFNEQATAARLDQVFEDLSTKIRPRDVFVFYAAGHGKTEDGRYYFVPQDFKYQPGKSLADLLAERGISQDRLQKWLSMIKARKSIVILDTCESGSLAGEQQLAFNTRGGLEQLAAVGRLIQATGRTTLTAAMDDQPAREGYRGHGVFTFAILDALARADRNGNGLVEVTELLEHVDALVPEITDKTWHVRQIPRSLFQGSNFALTTQLASLAPAPGEEMIISTKPTHVVVEVTKVFAVAGGAGAAVIELAPFTLVTLVKTEEGWVLVAKDGAKVGYVAGASLKPVQ